MVEEVESAMYPRAATAMRKREASLCSEALVLTVRVVAVTYRDVFCELVPVTEVPCLLS
jgi:hypothetical protein